MKYFILVLLVISQAACVGTNKPRPDIALYDFGYTSKSDNKEQILAKINVDEISAIEALNYQKMRYRLNYENAARVFYYTESRWQATPAELVNNQLNTLLQSDTKAFNCSLKLKLQLFDHVFNSKNSSAGVVQMSAILATKSAQKIMANEVIIESVPAVTANAEGGAKALAQASENALIKAINWANAQAKHTAMCN